MAELEPLADRRVVVYVSGSIAAYKACEVVTSLRKLGASVRVAMTEAGAHFVSPMTFQSLSGNPVVTSVWDTTGGAGAGHGMGHIALSQWAELQVAVPASADLIARLALGMAGDAPTATALACSAPLVVVPAMETAMWEHPATTANIATLVARGAAIVGPATGRLASGEVGAGRMAEPDEVVEAVRRMLGDTPTDAWLTGGRVVVTAGGTREPIDPVRYIGNRSSGKMGLALAREALRLGARVTLVTAAPPPAPQPGLDVVEVATAAEMLDAVRAAVPGATALLMAAAVADYRPAEPSPHKLKKRDQLLALGIVPTVDVLRELREDLARYGVLSVGFAAETDDLLKNARQKLEQKGLDLIVANDVGAPGIGMGSDDNAVTIIARRGFVTSVPRSPKPDVAKAVFAAMHEVRATRD
jgi:phosphopantothenoylcysteine decarboxylase / phosphopantothenate---cysteine ligase